MRIELLSSSTRRSELNDAILEVVAGQGHNVKEQYHSQIRDIARKIKWNGPSQPAVPS